MDYSLPTVVSGLGRCGTSMMMQMLHCGGMEVTGDAELPFLEDDRVNKLPLNDGWLRDLTSRNVIKILNPDIRSLPGWFRCRSIWMKRDVNEQTKSYIKYNVAMAGEQNIDPDEVANNIRRRTKLCLKELGRISDKGPLLVGFEVALERPFLAAVGVQAFLGEDLNHTKMAEAVIKRTPKCLVDVPEIKFAARRKLKI